jgi:hypothetical protein
MIVISSAWHWAGSIGLLDVDALDDRQCRAISDRAHVIARAFPRRGWHINLPIINEMFPQPASPVVRSLGTGFCGSPEPSMLVSQPVR